jgi:hypothetical protein
MSTLAPRTQRNLMISDLFLNKKLTVSEIIKVLDDENYQRIVLALIEQEVVLDRRKHQKPTVWNVGSRDKLCQALAEPRRREHAIFL